MKQIEKFCFLLILLFGVFHEVESQENFSVEHFLVEDGLPHNTVTQIIQDKKGFIWLATFNGLSKYDGYTFQNYKAQSSGKVLMRDSRIDKIVEDEYGRIWIRSNSNKVNTYCFDPSTESFWSTELIPDIPKEGFTLSSVKTNKSGLVWLLSEDDGCILVSDSLFNTKIYSKRLNTLNASGVNSVYEDAQKNSWLLTNNGLAFLEANKLNNPYYYLSNQLGQAKSFFTTVEFDDEIWFGGSNGTIAKYSKSGRSFRTQKLELDANITWMKKLNGQNVLAFTDQEGFCTINIYTGNVQYYNSKTYPDLNTTDMAPVALTQNRWLWFVGNQETGIRLFDFSSQQFFYYPSNTKGLPRPTALPRSYVFIDNMGGIWVQPKGGGFSKFNPENRELVPFDYKGYFPKGNFSNSFLAAFFDKQGNLWYSTRTSGLVKVVFIENNFKTTSVTNEYIPSSINDVRAILQDKEANVWVGNKQNQIVLLDKDLNKIGDLSPSGKLIENAIWDKPAYKIMQDSQSNIWIGTRGDGLYKLIPEEAPFSYEVVHFKVDKTNPYSISSNDIYSIFQDNSNRIWLGTFDGGVNLIETNVSGETHFINYKNKWHKYPIDDYNKVRCINQTPEGLLCAGTTKGLLVFNPNDILKPQSEIETYEAGLDGANTGLNGNDVIDICITKRKEIFIATTSGGIDKVTEKDELGFPIAFKSFTKEDGLPSNNVLSLLEDADGKLWIATDYTLARFNPDYEFFEAFHEVKPIISNNIFSEATNIQLTSGKLLFGYSEGLLHFLPGHIKTNNYVPYLALSNFKLFNQKVSVDQGSPLRGSLNQSKKLVLSHNQNFFTVEFAALDYKKPENINYSYKLEGFDKTWNYSQTHGAASYTNVPNGEYIFKVKSTNSQGVWTNNQRQLPIIIEPSIWNTNLAYVLYGLAFIAAILLINHTIITIYRLKTKVKLEKEMSNMKQKFFIDISHELRTPLTLISSPIEYLLNDNRTPESIKKQLTFIAHSSNRLQRLVNQILDFRKIEETKMKVSEINLTTFVKDIFDDFSEVAKEQDIDFTFHSNANQATIWADSNGLEKIIINLLSNAFKYTPNGKSIDVKITKHEKELEVHVIDQGIGISKENQKKLFNRFVSFNNKSNNPSTGIGLSLVKEIADKHHARLLFDSEEGKGSSFSVYFKFGKVHFSDKVDFTFDKERADANLIKSAKLPKQGVQEKIKVLLVEDEPDLRAFIKSILEDGYDIIEAEDGEMGYAMATKETPAFIISDIMMPKLNGVDLLKKIRNNVETSHIPVILLTAKTNIESKIEGLSYGADDYITKPFSVPYFKARIENLLNQRKRLQDIFSVFDKNVRDYNPMPSLITEHDEDIMKKVMQAIEENIDNNDFSVEELGSIIGINRTTFGNKIKSLTGFTPVEFIRDIRLKRAAQLIVDTQLLIKQVAAMTGFSDMKYFSKSFKKKYGITPIEYRKQNK